MDDTDTKLASQLNAHLASIVQTLPPLRPDEIPLPDYQDLPIITAKMLTKKLRMLKQTSVTPIDIPIQIIKAFPEKLSQPLSNLFNHITISGNFPSLWKKDMCQQYHKKMHLMTSLEFGRSLLHQYLAESTSNSSHPG